MIEDSDIEGVEYGFEEAAETPAPAQKKRPSKARRLVSVALLALLLIIGVIVLTPGLQREFLPQPRAAATKAPAKPAPEEESGPLPPVPVLWENVNVSAMSADVAQNLRLGKYYYDRKLPGNFGLAVHHWKQALDSTGGGASSTLGALVASAERELANLFSTDSEDVRVFLKQGRRQEAVLLLEKMRANYLDIESPQYVWASMILARYRR